MLNEFASFSGLMLFVIGMSIIFVTTLNRA